MHFNENAGRPQAMTTAGVPQYAVTYSKNRRGEAGLKKVKASLTFGKSIVSYCILNQY